MHARRRTEPALTGKHLLKLGSELAQLAHERNVAWLTQQADRLEHHEQGQNTPIWHALTMGLEALVTSLTPTDDELLLDVFEGSGKREMLSTSADAIYQLLLEGFVCPQLILSDGQCTLVWGATEYLAPHIDVSSRASDASVLASW